MGTTLHIPDDPPGHAIAPENDNSLDLGPGGVEQVRIRLHDGQPVPMTNVRYAVDFGSRSTEGLSADGWIMLTYPAGVCATVTVAWGAPDAASDHPYRAVIVTDCSAGGDQDQATARLHNLGYYCSSDIEGAVEKFQADYGIDEQGA